jgi:hypothetical protein
MSANPRFLIHKDREQIILKFKELIEKAKRSLDEWKADKDGMISGDLYWEIRTSGLNLLSRLTDGDSFYVRELRDMQKLNPAVLKGILEAALTDFMQGFMADTKLLVSAEVFADFLVQAEVLLENDYKDAAAVIIRAVLEDGLRRVCLSKGIAVKPRDGIHELADQLTRRNFLTAVQTKEIQAKKEIGNKAAHGKFAEYTKEDVVAFHEFVQRLLATMI